MGAKSECPFIFNRFFAVPFISPLLEQVTRALRSGMSRISRRVEESSATGMASPTMVSCPTRLEMGQCSGALPLLRVTQRASRVCVQSCFFLENGVLSLREDEDRDRFEVFRAFSYRSIARNLVPDVNNLIHQQTKFELSCTLDIVPT